MSWLYSRVLVEEYLEGNSLDGEPFAQSSENPMPQAFLSPDKMTAFSRLSRFGMTFAPLTVDLGEDVLTWFLEGFHAKTLAQQDEARGLVASEAGCGPKWEESFAKWDRDSCLWKTPRCLPLGELTSFSGTWPRWGIMLDGECFRLPPLVPSMSGNGYSYLPTPTCHNAKEGNYPAEQQRNTPLLATHAGGKINPEWTEWLMGWPHGWTDLSQSATANFQKWSDSHGKR